MSGSAIRHAVWLLLVLPLTLPARAVTNPPQTVTSTTGAQSPAAVKLGRAWTLPAAKRLDSPILLGDSHGRLWAFGQVKLPDSPAAIVCARFDGQKWTPLKEVVAPVKFTLSPMTAVLGSDDNPMVLWVDSTDQPGKACLYCTQWTGQQWSKPKELALTRTNDFPAPSACRDSKGIVHVVYRSNLNPSESYSQGLVVVDGVWSPKLFHLTFDGRAWTSPQPTTGRGRFGMGEPHLGLDPNGKVFLATEVTDYPQLGPQATHFAMQTYADGRWSELQPLTTNGEQAGGCSMAVDAWGFRHIVWHNRNSEGRYIRLTPDGKAATPSPEVGLDQPMLKSSALGWVVRFSRGGVDANLASVWTGEAWTPPLVMPDSGGHGAVKLAAAADGAMFAFWDNWGTLCIQEILLTSKKAP